MTGQGVAGVERPTAIGSAVSFGLVAWDFDEVKARRRRSRPARRSSRRPRRGCVLRTRRSTLCASGWAELGGGVSVLADDDSASILALAASGESCGAAGFALNPHDVHAAQRAVGDKRRDPRSRPASSTIRSTNPPASPLHRGGGRARRPGRLGDRSWGSAPMRLRTSFPRPFPPDPPRLRGVAWDPGEKVGSRGPGGVTRGPCARQVSLVVTC